MALSASIHDASVLLNWCHHKFEGILEMHGVKTGSREDIPGFLEKLNTDRYFAMDFWALLNSLEGRIRDEQVLRTLVDCVCGEWLGSDDPAVVTIIQEFSRASQRAESVPAEPEPGAAEASYDAGLRIREYYVDSTTEEAGQESPADYAGSRAESDYLQQEHPVVELGSGAANGGSERIDLMLARLELSNHELKLHLDSIDNRISRLEPHIERLASQTVKPMGIGAALDAAAAMNPVSRFGRVRDEMPAEAGPAAPTVTKERVPVMDWVAQRRATLLDWMRQQRTALGTSASEGMKSLGFGGAKEAIGRATLAPEFDTAHEEVIAEATPAAPVVKKERWSDWIGQRRAVLLDRMRQQRVSVGILASQGMKSLTQGAPRKTKSVAGGAIPVTEFPTVREDEAIPVAPAVKKQRWTAAMDWVRQQRMTLEVVANALGVGACLWLVIWLWGRPRENVAALTPVAASTTAAVSKLAEKTTAAVPEVAIVPEAVTAPAVVTVPASAPAESVAREPKDAPAPGPAVVGGLQRVSSKVDEPGGRDYVAPPSTKWYDGSHQPGAGPATAPDSAPPRDSGAGSGSAPEAKSGTGGPAEHTGTPAGASTLLTRSGGAAGSTPGGTKQVQVSSGVMATNLVESHEPDYPRLAKLSHLEGPVVMEVLISDRGTVDRINVVKGHRLLRGAAMDAVKNWKYRPYTVNGEPVDVSTTVTVNFSLDQ